MKKIITIILLLALTLTACTSNNNDTNNDSGNMDNNDPTLGDTNGDGNIEGSENNDMPGGENTMEDSDAGNFTKVDHVKTADDAVNFIGANVYGICKDVVPMMTETRLLRKDDLDSVTYNTGLTDVTGIDDIILSESMVGSFAYSLIMLRTDGKNTDTIAETMGNNINPAKWVCVSAEAISSITLDNDIILVMGDVNQVDTIMNAVVSAADGIYDNIGTVEKVL